MAFCNQCGAEIPADGRFCPGCGKSVDVLAAAPGGPTAAPRSAATPASMPSSPASNPIGWILPALVIVALGVIAYLLLAPRSGDRTASVPAVAGPDASGGVPAAQPPTSDPGSGTYTSAAVMDSAFSSNPAAAAVRYAGPVRVTGVIATMVQPGSTPSLSMEGRTRFNYVIVNFPAGYRERLALLSEGQSITVACDSARGLAGTTILSGCLLT